MLTYLSIKNFAIIDAIDLEFHTGTTVFTGETGAGKSIIVDALQLVLGGRAETQFIGQNNDRCEIVAVFNLQQSTSAHNWLQNHDLEQSDEECIIRRVVNKDGRSRCFINGQVVPAQQVREFSSFLVAIHDQHQQFTLLNRDRQRELLDNFANLFQEKKQLLHGYAQWHAVNQEYRQLQKALHNRQNQLEYINYQLQEFENIAYQPNEWEQLHQEYKQLSQSDGILQACQQALVLLSTEEEITLPQLIKRTKQILEPYRELNSQLNNIYQLITSADIELQEANHELNAYFDQVELNPERQTYVSTRLDAIHQLARKYHIQPSEIPARHQELQTHHQQLLEAETRLQEITGELTKLQDNYTKLAESLSQKRKLAAKKFSAAINRDLPKLGIQRGKFMIEFETLDQITEHGQDKIEFMISFNPGQPSQPLAKIASGGELSRVCLIIYLITAESSAKSTLIFDEVDVGISGPTAAHVGLMLRSLGASTQVICITHLPQVAAFGHSHIQVSKKMNDKNTQTKLTHLNQEQRVEEIARLLGGLKVTEQTRAHARELLCHE